MKTALFTAMLSIAFLSAGAFASDNRIKATVKPASSNETVITKNQAWPIKGRIANDSCAYVRCVDI
jgi:hypothetical protein